MELNGWQKTSLGLCWSLFGLVVLSVGTRFYIKSRLTVTKVGWDDWTILIATLLSLASAIANHMCVDYGVGKHLPEVPPQNLYAITRVNLVYLITTTLGVMFVKISVCLFLLRLIEHTNRMAKWLISLNLAVTVPITLAVSAVLIADLVPYYGPGNSRGHRFQTGIIKVMIQVAAIIGAVTDVTTAAMPIAVIWRLQIPRVKKYAISAVLALGFVIAASAIVKSTVIIFAWSDFTFDVRRPILWTTIEHNGGIIVASLATMGPLFRRLGPQSKPQHQPNVRPLNSVKLESF